jgi:DNA-binding transcriptional ArsR family regulator
MLPTATAQVTAKIRTMRRLISVHRPARDVDDLPRNEPRLGAATKDAACAMSSGWPTPPTGMDRAPMRWCSWEVAAEPPGRPAAIRCGHAARVTKNEPRAAGVMAAVHGTDVPLPIDVAYSLMISFVLSVEDLADTRFAVSPLCETVFSLRVLRDPGLSALHLPWRRSVLGRLRTLDNSLLMSLVAERRTLPDFLTPRPASFAPAFEEELAVVRESSPDLVRRDLLATHAPNPLPEALHNASSADDAPVVRLRDAICELLRQYWENAIKPMWPQMRQLLEADMTYRARQLATGGARLLFADMHPNLRWQDGVLHIDKMIGRGHRVLASGRGLLLVPSVFAHKPAPPVSPEEPPLLVYPSRGVATLWTAAPTAAAPALASLLGLPRARLLGLLDEPLPTVEIARRFGVTASAVSQQLRVLHATGLLTRARDGRQVLYHRSPLGDQLIGRHQPATFS